MKYQLLIIIVLSLTIISCAKNIDLPEEVNCPEYIIDSRDNQVYPVVKIGNQCWLQKNMNYDLAGSCYDYLPENCNIYGRIYKWDDVLNGDEYIYNESTIKGICPEGFHIPTIYEWRELIDFLGGEELAGRKMISDSLWRGIEDTIPKCGFNALPAGTSPNPYIYLDHIGLGRRTRYFSSTFSGDTTAVWSIVISIDYSNYNSVVLYEWAKHYTSKFGGYGSSCRCIRD